MPVINGRQQFTERAVQLPKLFNSLDLVIEKRTAVWVRLESVVIMLSTAFCANGNKPRTNFNLAARLYPSTRRMDGFRP